MVITKKISSSELPELVRISYVGDSELLASGHVVPFEKLEDAVDMTLYMIEQMAAEKKLNYFAVIWHKKVVGYYITFDNILFSFGVNIKFRNKEVLTGWWSWVIKSLAKNFICILYPHQLRTIEFLNRNGMVVAEVDKKNNSIILIHKN